MKILMNMEQLVTKIKMKKENKKSLKEIGLWTITCWIFYVLAGLTAIFSGVVTIQADQFFTGLLFFVLAIFTLIPRKYLRISRPLKVVIFIALYFTLLIISGFNAPTPEQQYEYYNLGQPFDLKFEDDIFSMTIYNVSAETEIVFEGQEISSSGVYLFVNGGVKNLGKNSLDFGFESELKDNQNNSYSLFAFDFGVGALQPNLERKFSNIFEIPKDISGLSFIVKDKTNIIKVINLEK